jgi:lysophospholipase L1-like esterase
VRSVIVSVLLVVGSVAFALLLGEGACRLAGYGGLEKYRPDRELGWVIEPGQSTITRVGHLPVRINDEGFRGDPVERPKPSAVVRIFALGGSSTFGWGVRERDTYHQVLERMLNDSARVAGARTRFEVVNGGVIGYNLWQVAHWMRRITQRYQPDGFLVAYTFNDAWNPVGHLKESELDRVLAGVRRKNLLRSSALFNWLIELRARRLAERAGRGVDDELATAQTGDTSATAAELAAYRATLDSMAALVKGAHLSLAFTVLAARGQRRPWPRQAAMADAALAAHVPQADLIPVFGAAEADSVYLPGDAVHPSPLGHEMIARRMYATLCAAAKAAPANDPVTIYRPGCGVTPQ